MKKLASLLKERKGFTLIELIIVIAILGVILLIGVPRFTDVLKRAQINSDKATAANIGKSIRLWNIDNLPSNRPVPVALTEFVVDNTTDIDTDPDTVEPLLGLGDYFSNDTEKPSSYVGGSEEGSYYIMANGSGKIAVAIGPAGLPLAAPNIVLDPIWGTSGDGLSGAFPANQDDVTYGDDTSVGSGWAYLEQ